MIDFDSLPPELRRALRESGWGPRRSVDVKPWVEQLSLEGYTSSRQAEEILSALGGLVVVPVNSVGPNFTNDEPFNFDPMSAGSGQRELAREIEDVLGGKYFPLGEWLSYSSVFVESQGRVVAAGLGWIWELGATFEDALRLTLLADRPLVCLHSGAGLAPWPR
ncbi:SUKH-3 domain-containing protein [Streptomyces sp. NRRL F-5123]|uniref:SUKH-3 domain-containing protein n=1 Tax=Streptomyces sp. NRRL F-5123 TaxID=1463856 RepID=UPI0004E230F0|nr:SUKH-3 domain-containing protein [Streptomyces sp. NRRL F-5123]